MAGSSNTQALIAAFVFGIVVNAATGTVFLYLKGHASSLWRDGLRLVLVTFLTTSALWAQIDFITTLISVNSPTGCQVAIVFASIFDQLARVSVQQAIIWAVNHHDRVSPAESILTQGAIVLRFVLGGIFVGLQRPQLDGVCMTSTSVLPYGFILLAADFTFTTAILARVISFGLLRDVRHDAPGSSRSRTAILIILGFGTWTGTSVPLMLGIRSVNMIARTAVPAAGVSILIGVLALFKDSLTSPKERPASPVEDANPPNMHTARNLQSRDISTADTMVAPGRYDDAKYEALESFKRASQFTTTALKTVPGAPKSTLPFIARPDVGQATTGIGGVPVQGQFFPPMRAQTMPNSLEPKKQRPDLSGKKVTKLMISGPVMSRDSEGKVLAKIPTVDLDSAILKEKQRVASGRIFAPSIRLASRTQLKPPPIPPRALNRISQSPTEEVLNGITPGGMVKVISRTPTREISVASTSSVMLSPALEELRRRSPRQIPPITPGSKTTASPLAPRSVARPRQYESPSSSPQPSPVTLDSKPLPKDPPYSAINFSVPVDARKSVTPFKHQNHKPDIRPSRQGMNPPSPIIAPTLPSPQANSPVLTPTKFGLPTHPRDSRIRVAETQSQRGSPEQNGMRMRAIEDRDPTAVKSVVEPTKNISIKSSRSISAPSPRVVSVVHRPRPIPRWPEIDRAIFPAEGSPNMHEHKRSLSNGTSRNKKSMVFLDAANRPVPFPPLPKSAGNISRSHPGDTRSMTWDEKMEMFYPQSGSVRSSAAGSLRRRSRSVPDMPALSMLLDEKLGSVSPHSYMHLAEDSARTSTTTQGISVLLEDFPRPRDNKGMGGSFLKFNSAAYVSTNRDVESRSPKLLGSKSLSKNGADRRSSPVLPPGDLSVFSPLSESKSRDDDASTNWGSIHSPVTVVNVQKARAVEVPTVPKAPHPGDETKATADVTEAVSPLSQDEETEASAVLDGITPKHGVDSASDMSLAIGQRQGSPGQGWHRRVGEECPTFSERGQPARPRKVPPPAPLLLGRTNLVPMEIQAQPSPLESPDHALAAIQEQLNRLEMPGSEQQNRMTLLANLETELGQQEDQWHGLRGTLMVRDSQSTLRTVTPSTYSVRDSRWNSLMTPLKEGYVTANQESRQDHPQLLDDGPAHSPSFQVSDPTQGDIAQQQLAQDQAGEVGIRTYVPTETDMKGNAQSSRLATSIHLLRPEGTDGAESEYEDQSRNLHTDATKALWCPISSPDTSAPGATQTLLWNPVVQVAKFAAPVMDVDQIPPVVHRQVRKDLEPLSIESSHLWENPLPKRRVSNHRLWRSLSPPAYKPETKIELDVAREQPVKPGTTRRPPRRIKRVTLLPDILESPKPIPDRRGTLGIFQFPWGEMSDIASLPERPSTMMAMPGLTTSIHGGFGANSTSFFEDYEAEEEGDSDYNTFSDSCDEEEDDEGDDEDDDDDDEDDGFDETVLWEIASLLTPSQERRSDSAFIPTKRVTHQLGEDSAARIPSDEATDHVELVRRDNSEALRFVTANFASSETEQLATQGAPSPLRTAVTTTTNTGKAPTRDQNTPKSDGPHATATPKDTDQGPWRLRLRQGFFQGSTDKANLNSATDGAARTLAPKAELINPSGDKAGDSGDDVVEFISNNRIPEPERVREPAQESVPPLRRCQSLAGAPMTTIPSAHETPSPHVPPIPVPPTSFSSPEAHPQQPPTWAWTLNSVHTATPPRQLPVLPAASRVLLPSADISAHTSAAAQDSFIIQSIPSDSSASTFLPDFFIQPSEQSPSQLPPQLTVPQHQTLLRNAYELSHTVGPMAMLWSPPSAPILRPSKGLYQPDAETWNSYLPIESASRALPRKAELARLESTALWTRPLAKKPEEPSHDGLWSTKNSQEIKTTAAPAMWTKPAVIEPVSYGLAQPDTELWSTYLSVEDETPRVKQRAAEPAVIESQSLWTKPVPAPVVKHDGLLWNSPTKVAPEAVNFGSGLWAPSPVEVDEEPVGLFSLSHRRSDFRTSSLSPAALDMERKRRGPLQPFPDFVFARLWNQAPLWDAAANYAKVKEREEIDALVLEGLFSLNHRRTNYRTTSEPPAALVTKTKPRISQPTLPKLTSDSLWSVQSQAPAPVEQDWLAISSGKSSRASSVASTSTDAAESTASASTVASSVSSDDISDEKPTRRIDATPAQWLEALREATAAADQGELSKDQAVDSSESPSFAYQLWSKRDDMADTADDDSTSMWKPSSSPSNNYLVLTASPGELDHEQLRASSATLRRNSKSSASRPPPPVFHGSTHSAFLPAVSETPRDFSAQALWSAEGDAMEALEEERAWLDKSLRNGMALLQLG